MSPFFDSLVGRRPQATTSRHGRRPTFRPVLDALEDRLAPAVTATFNPTSHMLVVRGDNRDNNIVVARASGGAVKVNGARVAVPGGFLKVGAVKQIVVNALAGNDTIMLNTANGGLPGGTLNGGAGNDTLIGGPNADVLNGGDGNDLLDAAGGADQVFGGGGDDTLIENSAVGGADTFNPGAGSDSIQINGSAGDDNVQISESTGSVHAFGAAMNLLIDVPGATDRLTVNGLAGNDTISAAGLPGSLIQLTLDGGAGDDTLFGSDGNDTLMGDAGNDFIDGNQGNDTAVMGAGNDTFVWDVGDGGDVVEGGLDQDILRFNGFADADDVFTATANGDRLSFSSDDGQIISKIDGNDLEELDINPLGGIDDVIINDLTATDVTVVNIDLGVNNAGDSANDEVGINGRLFAADVIQADAVNGHVQVTGLAAQVNIFHTESNRDDVRLNGAGGNDTLAGGTLSSLIATLILNGGNGDDTLNGGNGNDILSGGDGDDTLNGGNGDDELVGDAGNDTIDGNAGADTVFMGDGNDTFIWNPGDGSDTVEGQAGQDTLRFNGAPGTEIFVASSNGGRLKFTRNIGNIVMDCSSVETLAINALGGADTVTINDVSPTDVTQVTIDLGVNAAGDGVADAITVNGATGADVWSLSGSLGSVTLLSPLVTIDIVNAESANDRLSVNTDAGNDIVNASGLANTSIQLSIGGGAGDDVLIGGNGADTIAGDSGNDIIKGGPGNDTLDGGADTDIVDGGTGNDTLDGGAGTDIIDGGTGTDTAANGETVTNVP